MTGQTDEECPRSLIYQIIGCGSVLVDGIHLTHSCPNVFTLSHRLLLSLREQWDFVINVFQYYVDRRFGRKLLSPVVLQEKRGGNKLLLLLRFGTE